MPSTSHMLQCPDTIPQHLAYQAALPRHLGGNWNGIQYHYIGMGYNITTLLKNWSPNFNFLIFWIKQKNGKNSLLSQICICHFWKNMIKYLVHLQISVGCLPKKLALLWLQQCLPVLTQRPSLSWCRYVEFQRDKGLGHHASEQLMLHLCSGQASISMVGRRFSI